MLTVEQYVEQYTLGNWTPVPKERAMLVNAIEGYLAEISREASRLREDSQGVESNTSFEENQGQPKSS